MMASERHGQSAQGGRPGQPRARHRDALRISSLSAQLVRQGHGWVTRDRDTGDLSRFRPGQLVDLISPEDEWVAQALVDPSARIVARVIGRDVRCPVDDDMLRRRALKALERRLEVARDSELYRVVHGDSDGLPGLTIDRYGSYLVAQLYTSAAEGLAQLALTTLMRTGDFSGAFVKPLPRDRRQAEAAGYWLEGAEGPEALTLQEHGVTFRVRPFAGHSTGLFLDMRENRRILPTLVPAGRVLNAFSYTGGFSVSCARAGARVDSVDLSRAALAWAKENFALNGIDPEGHRFLAEDALKFLRGISAVYDLVILDPPTFSTSRDNVWSPDRLTELNGLALAALKPGGWLATFSNTAGLKEEEFQRALHLATLEARHPVQIVRQLQAGPDFPWLPGFPETRHLKGLLVRWSGP